MKRIQPLILASFAVVALLAGGIVFVILSHSDDKPTPTLNVSEVPHEEGKFAPASNEPPSDAEQRLQQALQQATTENGRAAVLDEFRHDPEARSTNQALRSTLIGDSSPRVRSKGFQVALELALKEDREALISILQEGVRNPYSEVRREGLRACRDYPHYELMDELEDVVEQGGRDRSVAVQALAFLDAPEAQRIVLETAQSETVPRADRIQAISLLSRSELDEAVQYLTSLATGQDAELKAFAMEALGIWQERSKK